MRSEGAKLGGSRRPSQGKTPNLGPNESRCACARRIAMGRAVLPDFDEYHREILPARCVTPRGREAAADVCGVPAIAFRLPDGRAYRFEERDGTIRILPGADAPTVVAVSPDAWADFATEMASGAGLLHGGRASFVAGTPADLERWEPALRALFHGRPFFDPGSFRPCDP